ncbi:MAG: nucleoside 2-deoxyribosyltransferase [archaeon]
MKIQLAYKMTGENREEVIEMLKEIKSILEEKSNEVYVPELNPDRPKTKKELYLDTLRKLDSADVLLAIIKSDDKSEGMLMEIGYAMGKDKKVVTAIWDCVKQTHLRELANQVIEFNNIDNLYKKLKEVDI